MIHEIIVLIQGWMHTMLSKLFFSLPRSDSFQSGLIFCWHSFFFLARSLSSVGQSKQNFARCSDVCSILILVQNLGGLPQKIVGAKTCKTWLDFGRIQALTANIFRTDEDIQNRPSVSSTVISPALGEKKSSEHWSTNCGDLDVESYPPKSTFLEDHISAPKVCCTLKFLHVLENYPSLTSSPLPGMGVPFTIIFKVASKIGLKFSVLGARSLEPGV